MPWPYSLMNACTICPSDVPLDCICAIRSLAGFEKWHSSMEQVATESLQPHWQAIRAPTRRTSRLGFSEAVCARAAAVNATRKVLAACLRARLRKLLCMFLGNAHHFGAGILHLHLARNQACERPGYQHQTADPDPGDQREHIRLNDRALVIV